MSMMHIDVIKKSSVILLFSFLMILYVSLYYLPVPVYSSDNSSLLANSNSLENSPPIINIPTTNNMTNSTDQKFMDKSITASEYDALKNCSPDTDKKPNSIEYLYYFNCGNILPNNNGNQTIREFTLFINENSSIPIASNGLVFPNAWTFNETIPGPTMRVTEGDMVRINVFNDIKNNHTHSLHMHSIHPSEMDGVDGAGGFIKPGQNFTYSFKAGPYGVYPYHCHSTPTDQHINKGLYGALIIDPKLPRQNMTEMVMMMNGYDLDYEKEGVGPSRIPTPQEFEEDYMPQEFEHGNEVYTVNGKAFDYMENPIPLHKDTHYRIYLINMLEFDQVNSFHLHGNVFKYYPSGTSTEPSFINDILTLGQGDRGILEFSYPYTGNFMFHSHINEFSDLGWMGLFNVVK